MDNRISIPKSPQQTYQTGLSLIELLIAMVLGLTLAAGVVQIYVGTSATERSQDARLRMQENGRFALNFLANEVRAAGYLGCQSSIEGASANDTLDHPVNSTMQPGFGVQGWEADGTAPGEVANSTADVAVIASTNAEWTGNQFAGFQIPTVQAVPNSDILRLWGGFGNTGLVTSISNAGVDPVFVTSTDVGIQDDDFLIISDCEQVDFVQACDAADAGLVTTVTLGTGCPMGNVANAIISSRSDPADPTSTAEVIRLQGSLYYVGKRDDLATNTPALFRATLDTDGTIAAPEEIIEGVESMQLLYGVNVDQDVRATADAWLTAEDVDDWDEVIAIQFSLMMVSVEDGTVPAPQAYTYNGVVYSAAPGGGNLPGDERVRRIFTKTLSLRNRALGT